MTSVSVIIPAYNSANTIIRALQSVAAQTLAPLEIIVVDDASTDTTHDLVTTFASSSSIPVRVVTQTINSGPSAARNAGWDRAIGDYIAFLDADDQWHPRKIELQYPIMQTQPEVTMSCHGPALRLETQLAHCSDPGYGGSGQSGQLLKMELSEIGGFVALRKSKAIGFGTLGTVVIWSWIKFGIRLFDSKVMKIRR